MMATLAFNELMLIYKDLLTLPVQRESFFLKKCEIMKKANVPVGFLREATVITRYYFKSLE